MRKILRTACPITKQLPKVLFQPHATIESMPKRKTADATAEEPLKSTEAPKRAAASRSGAKSKSTITSKPASHKLTTTKKAVQPATAPSIVTPKTPSRESIARLAYSYWEQRGYQGGSETEDWIRAESELVKLSQDR